VHRLVLPARIALSDGLAGFRTVGSANVCFAAATRRMIVVRGKGSTWKKGPFYSASTIPSMTVDVVFTLLYTSDAAWNATRWNNAEFDKLVAEGRQTID